MKKTIILGAVILFAIINSGCTKKYVQRDSDWMESRLTERIKLYQVSLINNEPEKLWNIALKSTMTKDPKSMDSYITALRASNHMAEYYDVKFSIFNIDMRLDRAKVAMSYMVTPVEGAKPSEAGMYDYWQFKDGDWYYAFGGKTARYIPEGWWW
jgi:hypothetical protein